ncbi:MAG: hypothetical protein Q9168_000186 [Polycauliona sp. 1 TL-2023]
MRTSASKAAHQEMQPVANMLPPVKDQEALAMEKLKREMEAASRKRITEIPIEMAEAGVQYSSMLSFKNLDGCLLIARRESARRQTRQQSRDGGRQKRHDRD